VSSSFISSSMRSRWKQFSFTAERESETERESENDLSLFKEAIQF